MNRDLYDSVGNGRVVDPHAGEGERLYAMFTHLSLIAAHALVPIVPALVMWLIKKDRSPFIDDHGREAINFQISLIVYAIGVAVLGLITCGAGWILWVPLYALGIVGMILAAISANRGEFYRYPMTIRFLS